MAAIIQECCNWIKHATKETGTAKLVLIDTIKANARCIVHGKYLSHPVLYWKGISVATALIN